MRGPLLSRPGAVAGDPPDAEVAAHYGDPFREQRDLVAGHAVVDLSHRPVLRVTGPDRLTWLHSLTSQHLESLAPGVATEALVLSPTGHVEHALYLVDDGDATWMHLEPGTADALLEFLTKMVFWSKVELERLDQAYAVVHHPPGSPAAPGAVARVTAYGTEVFLPRDHLSDHVADRPLAGMWALEALRIADGRPRLGFETDHRTIPHEVGWLATAVHLDKGCYRGQETVARVHNLGRPPRRLVLLHLDGSDSGLPRHGDEVLSDGRNVGYVGSAARHHELGPIALAVVKRSVPVEATLQAGGVAAAQEPLVTP
jgi:folate-binding protein YgfZ